MRRSSFQLSSLLVQFVYLFLGCCAWELNGELTGTCAVGDVYVPTE